MRLSLILFASLAGFVIARTWRRFHDTFTAGYHYGYVHGREDQKALDQALQRHPSMLQDSIQTATEQLTNEVEEYLEQWSDLP